MKAFGILKAMLNKVGHIHFVVCWQTMENGILVVIIVLERKKMVLVASFVKDFVRMVREIANTTIIAPPSLEPSERPVVHEERDVCGGQKALDKFLFGGKCGNHLFWFQDLRDKDVDLVATQFGSIIG